ncbi:serine hydrolase [uncultured Ramlibacter sp.]|uniref:serine hydrolase domain-containing protein n=1 Tax=uncultured Ramlibacter sp. TaxID=260755 RepID=UPI00261E6954|nr:serine hydrolase [uncultured Ramlibacter sp.]
MSTPDFSDAIAWAQQHEVDWPRDPAADPPRWGVHHVDPPPYNRLRGLVHARGPVSGVVWQHGKELAAWGEPERADLTFSVAKTYLAVLAGVAQARGLLPDADEPVVRRLPGIGFDDAHNRQVTWAHLLEQTSEWQGICLGMPDQVEHYRRVSHDPKPPQGRKGDARPLQAPGSYWEYNDVRINQLSLALLHLFGRPLPQVLREAVMQPIGASDNWQWVGYDDAWVEVGGQRVQSVPGGSHWGAGLSIGARDQARLGQLLLDGGRHAGSQLLPQDWIERMQQPCAIAPFYGRLAWLNRGGSMFADASHTSWFMVGAGGHYVWIDPQHQAVVVVRWLGGAGAAGFVSRMAAVLKSIGS